MFHLWVFSSCLIFSVAKYVWKCAVYDSFAHDWLVRLLCCHLSRSQGRDGLITNKIKQLICIWSYAQICLSCSAAYEHECPLSVLFSSWSMIWASLLLLYSGYGQRLPASSSSTALLTGRENLFLALRTSDTRQYMPNTYTICLNITPNVIITFYIYTCSKTSIQKFGVSKFFFLKKLILLFSKDALNWSKVTVKTNT